MNIPFRSDRAFPFQRKNRVMINCIGSVISRDGEIGAEIGIEMDRHAAIMTSRVDRFFFLSLLRRTLNRKHLSQRQHVDGI